MSEPDLVTITSGALTARINPLGAELWSITDPAGREYMTDADPAFWTGHAPILFPVIGALREDAYRLDGKRYAMGKHGFARHSRFTVADSAGVDTVRLELADSAETRAAYPFAFLLALTYRLEGNALRVTAEVTNRDARAMPFSFGFHPALAWPLPGGAAKLDHTVAFAEPEPGPIRRIDPPTGLLLPEPQPSPVEGHLLHPRPELFEPDALIWDRLASRSVTFGAPGGAQVEVAFADFPMLGIWQKPGAHYLCIEPWQGIADPVGFDGDLREKPGIVELATGATRRFSMTLTVIAPD